jgi:hypothetical protein
MKTRKYSQLYDRKMAIIDGIEDGCCKGCAFEEDVLEVLLKLTEGDLFVITKAFIRVYNAGREHEREVNDISDPS